MRRGDIVSVVLPRAFGKPRPAVIVQSNALAAAMITTIVCPMTSDLTSAPSFRLTIAPTSKNGLTVPSQIMVDKIQALPTDKVGPLMGRLEPEHVLSLNRALLTVLALP